MIPLKTRRMLLFRGLGFGLTACFHAKPRSVPYAFRFILYACV